MPIQIQVKRPLDCLSEQLLKNQCSKHRRSWVYRLTVLRPRGHTPFRPTIRGGGVATERGGGVLRSEYQAGYDSQRFLTISYISHSANITCERACQAIHLLARNTKIDKTQKASLIKKKTYLFHHLPLFSQPISTLLLMLYIPGEKTPTEALSF
jgi:hypothetical protein